MTDTLEQLQLNSCRSKEPTITQTYNSVAYPSYYITVISASECEVETSLDKEKELLRCYYLKEGKPKYATVVEGQEHYEKFTGFDEKFFKFKKEMSKCPQQLIR